jgi:hypothetical protein
VKVAHATLGATPDRNDDRVFITDNAVIVMDGASAFLPTAVDTGTYVDTLGAAIVDGLQDQAADLRTIVADAIRTTTTKLDLRADGTSPSSTVSIVRVGPELVDIFVLGDSPVILSFTNGTYQRITDDRLARLHFPAREAYRARLAAGHGYDDEHHRLLRELQTQQREVRNRPDGYWIAESNPAAAEHALISSRRRRLSWAVLLTDGAERSLGSICPSDWSTICRQSSMGLARVLQHCYAWELANEPLLAKKHDDKTLATIVCHDEEPVG